MEFRPLDVTVLSAKGLKDVNLMTTMDVYAVVHVLGDQRTAQKTPVDKDCGTSPKWNFPMKFTVDEAAAAANRLTLSFKIMSERALGDREIGEVHVPVKELLDAANGDGKDRAVSYSVRTPKGKAKGTLDFSYRFGEKYNYAPPEPASKGAGYAAAGYGTAGYGYAAAPQHEPVKMGASAYAAPPPHEPVMAYPATAHPGSSSASAAAYPPPGGYPPYTPQQGYGGYPGHGYPNQYPAQGYGYPPVQQVKPPKKSGAGKLGLGLAGGLLGGLLIGDMIGDVGEMAAYDAGFDDGMDF